MDVHLGNLVLPQNGVCGFVGKPRILSTKRSLQICALPTGAGGWAAELRPPAAAVQELDSLIQGGVSSFEDYGKQLQARIEDATPESVLGEAGALAKGALDGVAAPFDIFSGDWFLNICFFSVVSILLYSLIIAAPRQ